MRVGSVVCSVKIVSAVTEADKIRFSVLNRKTGNKVRSVYVDEETGKEVPAGEQVKGWETDKGDFIEVESEEIKALKPTSEHTLDVDEFVPVADIDSRYLEKPYYLMPADKAAAEPFEVLREAMERAGMAARACVVMYQRGHEVAIQSHGRGMLLTWLRNDNAVISESTAFGDFSGGGGRDTELLEIAGLLIDKKPTEFDPVRFEDRYEEALAEMIEAKRKGAKVPSKPAPQRRENVVDLMETLKNSLRREGVEAPKAGKAGKSAKNR